MARSLWTDDDRVHDLVDRADLMYLAVAGRHGPRVTPLAFQLSDSDLWAVTPRRSAKVRALRRDARVGVLIRDGDTALLLAGRAHLVDPLAGRDLGSLLRPDLPLIGLGYLGRNDRRVLGALRDHPSPTLALSRTGLRITVSRVALVCGNRIAATWGTWPDPSVLLTGALPPRPFELDSVADPPRSLLTRPNAAAVLGWTSPLGPIAVPAQWDPSGRIEFPAAALTVTGAMTASPACLAVQASGTRLRSVRGLVVAGAGRARVEGATGSATIEADTITWWSGENSHTVGAAAPRGA